MAASMVGRQVGPTLIVFVTIIEGSPRDYLQLLTHSSVSNLLLLQKKTENICAENT